MSVTTVESERSRTEAMIIKLIGMKGNTALSGQLVKRKYLLVSVVSRSVSSHYATFPAFQKQWSTVDADELEQQFLLSLFFPREGDGHAASRMQSEAVELGHCYCLVTASNGGGLLP
eukprot:g54949.t1